MLSLCSGIVLLQSGSELIVFGYMQRQNRSRTKWNKGRTTWNQTVIVKRIFRVYNSTIEKVGKVALLSQKDAIVELFVYQKS